MKTESSGRPDEAILLTQPGTARLLGVSVDTVRALVKHGVLEPVRLQPGAHPRFRRDDVEALARGNPVSPQPELAVAP